MGRDWKWLYALVGVVVGATIAIIAMWLGGWKMTKVVVNESTSPSATSTSTFDLPSMTSPPGSHNPAEKTLEAFVSLVQERRFDQAYALISDSLKAKSGDNFEAFKTGMAEGLDQGAFTNFSILSSSQEGNMYRVKWETNALPPYTARIIKSNGNFYIDSLGEEMDMWNSM